MPYNHSDMLLGEAIEAAAFADLFENAPDGLASHGLQWRRLDEGCILSFPTVPAMILNRIQGVSGLSELKEACAWLQVRSPGASYLQICENDAPMEVCEWIGSKRFVNDGPQWLKLLRGGQSVPESSPKEIVVRPAGREDADLFARMVSCGFGLPAAAGDLWRGIVGASSWTCLIAELDGRPIATGAMYMRGSCAWLGATSTIADWRSRGGQTALIRARLEAGIRQGVTTFCTEVVCPKPGEHNTSLANLQRFGFEQRYARSNFRLSAI